MNAIDILKYGHKTVAGSIDGLSEADWHTPGVAGEWTVKQIVNHLASFEQTLIEVLRSVLTDSPTPTLEQFIANPEGFNESQVARRREQTKAEAWDEYEQAHARTVELMAQIPLETRRQKGILPWYGAEYDLEDFIVYTFYGHKREHSAHLSLFRDHLAAAETA